MFEKIFKMIFGLSVGTYSAIASSLSQTIWIVAKILYIPPFSWVINNINRKYVEPFKAKVTDSLIIDSIDSFFKRFYKDNKLLSGDLEGYARERYPEEKYPSFYMDIPAQIRRPIIVDSRLITGESIARLADNHLTNKRLASSVRHSITTASAWAGIALGAWLVASIVSLVFGLMFGSSVLYSTTQTVDYWNVQIENSDMALQLITGSILYCLQWLIATVFSVKAVALLAITFVFVLVNSTLIRLKREMDYLAAPLQKFTKNSVVGWKLNTETRRVEYEAYIERIGLYKNYLIPNGFDQRTILGEATGIHLARNASASSSPLQGEEVGPDREAMFTGLMVCGNTGAGKTRYVIAPVMRQLMSNMNLGMYITDAKAVLHYDAKKIAKEIGREGDIVTVGTGPNDYGIDLLSGMSPSQVADVLRDIMTVMGGGGKGGDFFIQKAYSLIKSAAVLADAYMMIPDGDVYAEDSEILPYSLVCIYEITRDPAFRDTIIQSIIDILNNDYGDYGWKLDTSELTDAIKYFDTEWATLAENTRTSVEATSSQVLSEFNGAPEVIRDRFATGCYHNIIDVDEALKGKIVCINLSMEEFPASRVLLMMLKARLFALAMLRQREYKDRGLEAQREAPNCAMIGDEYQSLITISDNGLSDGSFWNMARSTGLFFACCGFQNLSSLIKTVGKEKGTDFVNMLVNKIVLNMNDIQTIEMIKQMSGKSSRLGVYDDNHYENWEAVKAEHGDGSIVDEEAELNDNPAYHAIGIVPYLGGFSAYKADTPTTLDDRFFGHAQATSTINISGGGGKDDSLSYMQTAYHRQEDKATSYITHGNEWRDVVTNQEIMGQLTRGYAWASWMEGGQLRQDFLKLDRKKTEADDKGQKSEQDYEEMLQNSRDGMRQVQA